MTGRLLWIDALKGMAILGVLINHYNIFPDAVMFYVMYAVPTFFWVIGFNIYKSIDKKKDTSFLGRLTGVVPFVFFYCCATLIYAIFYYKTTNIHEIFTMILNFTATGPLYFCPIYISIFLISGVLYNIINYESVLINRIFRRRCFYYMFAVAICLVFSLLMKHFYIYPNLHGGGKYLFGKTYLFIVFMAMLYCKFYDSIIHYKKIIYCVLTPVLLGTAMVMPEVWSNPPNALAIAQSFSIFALASVFDMNKIKKIALFFSLLGRYSIHIFMYHMFVIYMLASLDYRLITFLCALFVPIAMGYLLNRLWDGMSRLFPRLAGGSA